MDSNDTATDTCILDATGRLFGLPVPSMTSMCTNIRISNNSSATININSRRAATSTNTKTDQYQWYCYIFISMEVFLSKRDLDQSYTAALIEVLALHLN